ncbi:hypothetical protein [Streptomyces sp. NRRL S-455]|uniref:hypothetical protein n=1 Tax=Streptomyces sp. NRRL S-455 TaxID=1463908 RepID=UPI00131A5A50|nr:hypothetical protein [Streptomyces sp. NRRL S-455]
MNAKRYRVQCLNPQCGWVGYRSNAYECECYDYPCRPTAPGSGCPNGANLRARCPRCKSDWTPARRDLFRSEYFTVRETWSREYAAQILRGRAKLRKEARQ